MVEEVAHRQRIFTGNSQCSVAVFLAEVGDVGAPGFEDAQAEQSQHGHQSEVVRVGRQAVHAARYRHLTSRQTNRLKPTQAQIAVAAAILRQVYAVVTTGQAWDPHIAAGGHRAPTVAVVAAA